MKKLLVAILIITPTILFAQIDTSIFVATHSWGDIDKNKKLISHVECNANKCIYTYWNYKKIPPKGLHSDTSLVDAGGGKKYFQYRVFFNAEVLIAVDFYPENPKFHYQARFNSELLDNKNSTSNDTTQRHH